MSFKTELRDLLNKHSKESDSNTPDYILARYLDECLDSYSNAVALRDEWNNENFKDRSVADVD